ncbi:MAG TPA: histidine kinase [Balneolales bacterium]|nr:histidine kinase [Balneolales bacterium]
MTKPNEASALLQNRGVQYAIFWLVSFLFLVNYFTQGYDIGLIDIVYTLLFHISLVFAVSINSFYLLPNYLAHEKYYKYSILLSGLIIISMWLNIFTFQYLSDWIFPGYYFVSYYEWWELLEFLIIYVGLTSMLEFSKSWFREMQVRREMAELEQERVQTELKALRSQINPHFLFNSLNHIYALSVRQSVQTSKAVLQLSELLRYAIDHMDRDRVPLRKELEYVTQFIEWHKARIDHPERIAFTCAETPDKLQIAPLLLVVFVENCFKHGRLSRIDDRIIISVSLTDSTLKLITENSTDPDRELPAESTGLGLENVRRRLNLLYDERHHLDIQNTINRYRVSLTIELE